MTGAKLVSVKKKFDWVTNCNALSVNLLELDLIELISDGTLQGVLVLGKRPLLKSDSAF